MQPADYSIHCKDGNIDSLQPKYMEVLVYLARHYPRIIPRQELITEIWDGNDYVGEKALTNTVWHLRQHLASCLEKDDSTSIIKTVRKSGYQLVVKPYWYDNAFLETETPSQLNSKFETSDFSAKFQANRSVVAASIVILLVISVFAFLIGKEEVEIAPGSVYEHITRDPGSEVHPAISPDGRFVSYAWFAPDGNSNLYLLDLEQPQLAPRQLTFGDAQQRISVWSNDGRYLFYARDDKRNRQCDIMRLNVGLNAVSKIAECTPFGGYHYIDISPDDATLAFRSYDKETRKTGIYLLNLLDENASPVRFSCLENCDYKDRSIAFSPDGKKLAISRRNYWFSEDVVIIDLDSGLEEILVTNEPDITGLAWHIDGEHIIYGTQRADLTRGFMISVISKQVTPLNVGDFQYPSIASKTGDVVYQSQSERYFLSKLDLNEETKSSPFPVVESEFSHLFPDYSHETDAIVYVSNESGFYELWMADSKGMNREQLTFLQREVNFPRWSHDGKKVAFLAPIEDTKSDKIHILDLDSKRVTALSSPYQLHNRPTWSYDDKAIISSVYTEEFRDLVKINIENGESTRLTFDGGRYGIMTSEDTIIYTRNRRGLWKKTLNGEPLRLMGSEFTARYSWVYAENTIFYSQSQPEYQRYMRFDLDTQELIEIYRLPPSQLTSYQEISMNLNENVLLFTNGKSAQADIKKLTMLD